MIVYEHPHVAKISKEVPLKIVAFGDVHWGARDCAEERFERLVLKEHAKDANAYFVGMGDIVDAIVTSDQKRYRSTVMKAAFATREDILDASIDEFAEVWEKYDVPKERIIGFLSGNHHDAILKRHGTDITERLCHRLSTKNLGYSAFVRILTNWGNHKLPFVLFAHHGFGGGTRTDGGSITKYVRHSFRYQGAAAYCYGHDHQRWAKRVAVVKPHWGTGTATDYSFVVAATGSFKRTVSNDQIPSYSEVAGLKPSEMGAIVITVKPASKKMRINGRVQVIEHLEVSSNE